MPDPREGTPGFDSRICRLIKGSKLWSSLDACKGGIKERKTAQETEGKQWHY